MEQYKEKLKKQNCILSVCIFILALCAVLPTQRKPALSL